LTWEQSHNLLNTASQFAPNRTETSNEYPNACTVALVFYNCQLENRFSMREYYIYADVFHHPIHEIRNRKSFLRETY